MFVAERLAERGVLLALRDHDDLEVRVDLAELLERLEAARARHLLVEQHEVERTTPHAARRRRRRWSRSRPRSPCPARRCGEARAAPPRRRPRGRTWPGAAWIKRSPAREAGAGATRVKVTRRARAFTHRPLSRPHASCQSDAPAMPSRPCPTRSPRRVFRFRHLAALAGRAPIGGAREVALACFVAARLVSDCCDATVALDEEVARARGVPAPRRGSARSRFRPPVRTPVRTLRGSVRDRRCEDDGAARAPAWRKRRSAFSIRRRAASSTRS